MMASPSDQPADTDPSACSIARPSEGRRRASADFRCAAIWRVTLVWSLALAASPAHAGECLRPQDDFFLVNVRGLGSSFCCDTDWRRILCRRLVAAEDCANRCWITVSLDDFYAADDPAQVTLIFVHGNRVDPGEDVSDTLQVYRALIACTPHAPPIRLVAFSWPTEKVRGPVRDYREKARRADPAGLHLAWVLSRVQSDVPVAIIGYSYGARVTGGALQLLAGGTLCGHALPSAANLADVRVLHIAAAVDNDWLLPGRPHGMALGLVDRLALINNQCDPAMRFYHVSSQRGRPVALGRYGMPRLPAMGDSSPSVCQVDACGQVGKRHALEYYLRSGSLMALAGRELLQSQTLLVPAP